MDKYDWDDIILGVIGVFVITLCVGTIVAVWRLDSQRAVPYCPVPAHQHEVGSEGN